MYFTNKNFPHDGVAMTQLATSKGSSISVLMGVVFALLNIGTLFVVGFDYVLLWLLYPFTILARVYLARQLTLKNNMAQMVVWSFFELNTVASPFIIALFSSFFYPDLSIFIMVLLGMISVILAGLIVASSNSMLSKNVYLSATNVHSSTPSSAIDWFSIGFLILAFVFTILSWKLGIIEMGGSILNERTLPFRLNGFIFAYRKYCTLFFVLICVDYYYSRRIYRKLILVVAIYVFWALLDSYLSLSKGSFIMAILPILIWSGYKGLFKLKQLIGLLVFFSLFAIAYPYLSTYRDLHHSSVGAMNDASFVYQHRAMDYEQSVVSLYTRVFMDVGVFPRLFSAYSGKLTGSRIGEILSMGGPHKYYTRAIVGTNSEKTGKRHSSGVPYFSEAYMLGGIPLVILFIAAIQFFAVLVDKRKIPLLSYNHAHMAMTVFLILVFLKGGVIYMIYSKFEYCIVILGVMIFSLWLHRSVLGESHQKVSQF